MDTLLELPLGRFANYFRGVETVHSPGENLNYMQVKSALLRLPWVQSNNLHVQIRAAFTGQFVILLCILLTCLLEIYRYCKEKLDADGCKWPTPYRPLSYTPRQLYPEGWFSRCKKRPTQPSPDYARQPVKWKTERSMQVRFALGLHLPFEPAFLARLIVLYC